MLGKNIIFLPLHCLIPLILVVSGRNFRGSTRERERKRKREGERKRKIERQSDKKREKEIGDRPSACE